MVGPWHTTVTAALRAGDLTTGDRDPIAIAPPTAHPTALLTGPPTDHIGADDRRAGRRISPDPARRVRWPMKAA